MPESSKGSPYHPARARPFRYPRFEIVLSGLLFRVRFRLEIDWPQPRSMNSSLRRLHLPRQINPKPDFLWSKHQPCSARLPTYSDCVACHVQHRPATLQQPSHTPPGRVCDRGGGVQPELVRTIRARVVQRRHVIGHQPSGIPAKHPPTRHGHARRGSPQCQHRDLIAPGQRGPEWPRELDRTHLPLGRFTQWVSGDPPAQSPMYFRSTRARISQSRQKPWRSQPAAGFSPFLGFSEPGRFPAPITPRPPTPAG